VVSEYAVGFSGCRVSVDAGEAVGGMVSVSRGCCCSSRPPPPGEAGGAPDTSPSQRDLGRLLMPPVSPSHLSPICPSSRLYGDVVRPRCNDFNGLQIHIAAVPYCVPYLDGL